MLKDVVKYCIREVTAQHPVLKTIHEATVDDDDKALEGTARVPLGHGIDAVKESVIMQMQDLSGGGDVLQQRLLAGLVGIQAVGSAIDVIAIDDQDAQELAAVSMNSLPL